MPAFPIEVQMSSKSRKSILQKTPKLIKLTRVPPYYSVTLDRDVSYDYIRLLYLHLSIIMIEDKCVMIIFSEIMLTFERLFNSKRIHFNSISQRYFLFYNFRCRNVTSSIVKPFTILGKKVNPKRAYKIPKIHIFQQMLIFGPFQAYRALPGATFDISRQFEAKRIRNFGLQFNPKPAYKIQKIPILVNKC